MLKYNRDLWNDDRNKESPHVAARIIHIDNEEKKKIRRLREEQARADEEDHFDNFDRDDLYLYYLYLYVGPDIIISSSGV